jgi:hypothetical protein
MPAESRPSPYPAYAALAGTFGGGLVAAGVAARLVGRDPRQCSALDLAVISMAAFKVARTVANDDVMKFVRAPFVAENGQDGEEEPVRTGNARQAIGELLTCSRCTGTWAAAGLTTAHVLSPRFGRMLTWSLAAAGADDWLQAGFASLTAKANELERRAAKHVN